MKQRETIICWYLEGNHHPKLCWVVQDFVHPQYCCLDSAWDFGHGKKLLLCGCWKEFNLVGEPKGRPNPFSGKPYFDPPTLMVGRLPFFSGLLETGCHTQMEVSQHGIRTPWMVLKGDRRETTRTFRVLAFENPLQVTDNIAIANAVGEATKPYPSSIFCHLGLYPNAFSFKSLQRQPPKNRNPFSQMQISFLK